MSGTIGVRTVTTTATTAGTAPGQEAGRQHEKSGVGIGVAGLIGLKGRGVGDEDLGAARMVEREAGRMWLGQLPRRALVHEANSTYLAIGGRSSADVRIRPALQIRPAPEIHSAFSDSSGSSELLGDEHDQ